MCLFVWFGFENNSFIVNHVCVQNDGKNNKEKFYFKDKTKSKKGYRTFPLFPIVKDAIINRFEQIEENKKLLGNCYNYKYDGYLCVQDNGDIIQPNYVTKDRLNIKLETNAKETSSTA